MLKSFKEQSSSLENLLTILKIENTKTAIENEIVKTT